MSFFHSHPDHFSTSNKCSGVDTNMARLLLHRVAQEDHPEIMQQVCCCIVFVVALRHISIVL